MNYTIQVMDTDFNHSVAPSYVHALDAYMINNAMGCIKLDFGYDMYVDWLESFTCTENPDLKINRLDRDTYCKLSEISK